MVGTRIHKLNSVIEEKKGWLCNRHSEGRKSFSRWQRSPCWASIHWQTTFRLLRWCYLPNSWMGGYGSWLPRGSNRERWRHVRDNMGSLRDRFPRSVFQSFLFPRAERLCFHTRFQALRGHCRFGRKSSTDDGIRGKAAFSKNNGNYWSLWETWPFYGALWCVNWYTRWAW